MKTQSNHSILKQAMKLRTMLNKLELEIEERGLNYTNKVDNNRITESQLYTAVMKHYPKSFNKTREQTEVFARHIFRAMLYQHTGMGLSEIGKKYGGYDHSTVIHSTRVFNTLISHDPKFQDIYNTIINECHGND